MPGVPMEGPAFRPALRLIRNRVGSGGRAGQCRVGVCPGEARLEAEGGVPTRAYGAVVGHVVGGHGRAARGHGRVPAICNRLVTAPGPGDLPGLGGHCSWVADRYVGGKTVAPAIAEGRGSRAGGRAGAGTRGRRRSGADRSRGRAGTNRGRGRAGLNGRRGGSAAAAGDAGGEVGDGQAYAADPRLEAILDAGEVPRGVAVL